MIFNLRGGPASSGLVFFDGALNAAVFGSFSGRYTVADAKLTVYGGGSGSTVTNAFSCGNCVDLSAFSKLELKVSENDHVKAAVRLLDDAGKQIDAFTITASSTGVFTRYLTAAAAKCRLLIDASSNADTDFIVFSSIVFKK